MPEDVKQTQRQLTIKTGVVKRLAKEVISYQTEASEQQAAVDNIANLPESDRSAEWEYELKNARKVQKDCDQMISPAKARFEEAYEALDDLVETVSSEPDITSTSEYTGAQRILEETKGQRGGDGAME